MSYRKFSRAFKRSVCIDYMQSGKTRAEIAQQYGLPNVNILSGWIQSCLSPLEIHEKCASLPPLNTQKEEEMKKTDAPTIAEQSATIEALQKQIAKLEKELKKSEDKNLALNVMIDIAEEQGIRIRKKSGVKQ